MLYLEALRRHLTPGIFPAGGLTNLTRFIFYRSTGHYSYATSDEMESVDQIAMYLYDLHVRTVRLDGEITAGCPSRAILDIDWPFGPEGPVQDGGDGANAEESGAGAGQDEARGGAMHSESAVSTHTALLTAHMLKRHDNALLIAARRRLSLAS